MLAVIRLTLALLATTAVAAEQVDLTPLDGAESDRLRVETRIRYQGTVTPELADADDTPQAIPVSGDQTLVYQQEALDGPAGTRRVVRVVERVEGLRPDRRTLIAEEHPSGARVASAGEPLSRSELDSVQQTADPLDLSRLLPCREVREAGTWRVSSGAMRRLMRLDETSVCEVTGILTEFNLSHAKLRLAGPVHGRVDGAEIEIDLQGVALFDRRAGRIARLNLGWSEKRAVGPSTPAVAITAKLNLTTQAAGPIPSDDLLLAAAAGPDWRIEVTTRDGRWRLLTDRTWFTVANGRQATTLRRLKEGQLAAVTTLVSAPGKGLTTAALENEVRNALGDQLDRVVQAEQTNSDGVLRRTVTSVGTAESGLPTRWRHDHLKATGNLTLAATTTLSAERDSANQAAVEQLITSARPTADTKVANSEADYSETF